MQKTTRNRYARKKKTTQDQTTPFESSNFNILGKTTAPEQKISNTEIVLDTVSTLSDEQIVSQSETTLPEVYARIICY